MTSRITETPLKIYTDGACSGNPGPAGVGAILFDSKEVYELSEFLGMGTNNIAELTAVLRVLERVGKTSRPMEIYTDSQYVIGVLTKGWRAKANQVLIESIRQCLPLFPNLKWHHVRGHRGHAHNERADELARMAVEQKKSMGWRKLSN